MATFNGRSMLLDKQAIIQFLLTAVTQQLEGSMMGIGFVSTGI